MPTAGVVRHRLNFQDEFVAVAVVAVVVVVVARRAVVVAVIVSEEAVRWAERKRVLEGDYWTVAAEAVCRCPVVLSKVQCRLAALQSIPQLVLGWLLGWCS